jgi:hypothetical protein
MRHTSVALAVNSFLGILPPPPNLASGRWALGEEDPPVRATRRCRVIQFSSASESAVDPDPHWIRMQWDPGSVFGSVFTIRIQEGKNDPQTLKKLIN